MNCDVLQRIAEESGDSQRCMEEMLQHCEAYGSHWPRRRQWPPVYMCKEDLLFLLDQIPMPPDLTMDSMLTADGQSLFRFTTRQHGR